MLRGDYVDLNTWGLQPYNNRGVAEVIIGCNPKVFKSHVITP